MQSSCMGALMELAEKDGNIVYLTADSGEGGLDLMFRRNFPERSFNFGIAEENMVAASAGLAAAGRIPFVYAAAPFLVYRSLEFIRNDICLQEQNVKLIGTGSGLSVSSLGPTHHTTEDIGILRTLPGLTIFSPATPLQAYACMLEAYKIAGPVYIRLGMNYEKEYFENGYRMHGIKPDMIQEGSDILFITTGNLLEEVVAAADLMRKEGVSVRVVHVPVIKPFDEERICEYAKEMAFACVIEEHNVYGGIGTSVADAFQKRRLHCALFKLGLNDTFSAGYGKLKAVRKENGLDAESIYRKAKEIYDEYIYLSRDHNRSDGEFSKENYSGNGR